jgi:hypothetical protein
MPAEFVFGANLPWFEYGVDFGANAWRPAGGVGRDEARDPAAHELAVLAETGVQAVRWFLFCDGRAGIRFDERGVPTGLDDFVYRDLDAALELLGREHMSAMFVLLDFHWCRPGRTIDGVQMGGRAGVLHDRRTRERLLEHVFRPVLERYGSEPSIFAWDVFNEPEWVAPNRLKDFMREAITMIRACSSRPVTIGSAGARWSAWYRDLDLDFYQVHWYDSMDEHVPLETPVAAHGFDRPVLLGEFPTRGSRRTWKEIVETARASGYAGAFYWSALSNDVCSDPSRRPICKAGSSFPPPSSARLSPR